MESTRQSLLNFRENLQSQLKLTDELLVTMGVPPSDADVVGIIRTVPKRNYRKRTNMRMRISTSSTGASDFKRDKLHKFILKTVRTKDLKALQLAKYLNDAGFRTARGDEFTPIHVGFEIKNYLNAKVRKNSGGTYELV